MSHSIYKYPLRAVDEQTIELPLGAQLLTVQAQNDQAQLWALVDTREQLTVKRRIRIYGTGHPVEVHPDSMKYIATFQLYGGRLVFHAFEDRS